jgi:hypothetical protein
VLTPYRKAKFKPHTGPFLIEFQRHGMSSEELCSRPDTFFNQLPKDFCYAVEIRNAGLLGPDYRTVLENHGVAHVYNHWSYMPPLREQHQRTEERFMAPFTVLHILHRSRCPMKWRRSERNRIRRLWKSCQRCGGTRWIW